MTNPIGPLPSPPTEYEQAWAFQLVDRLDQIHDLLNRVINTGYQMSNVTKTRALDANSTSLAEIADVLGTLIDDMKDRGTLGG